MANTKKTKTQAAKPKVEEIKEVALKTNGYEPLVIMQATHSGRYSKPYGTPAPLIAYNNPIFEKENPISEDRIVTDEYLDIVWVMSGRGRGKSFEISSQLIADAWYDKKQFGYIRRNDCTIYDVEQYFADKEDFIKDIAEQKGKMQ